MKINNNFLNEINYYLYLKVITAIKFIQILFDFFEIRLNNKLSIFY